jgi:ABC-type glutathione transport system ATPase component
MQSVALTSAQLQDLQQRLSALPNGRRPRGLRHRQGTVLSIALAIAPGEVHALVGPNGSGKTTLARALMCAEGYCPASGIVRFADAHLLALPMHERAPGWGWPSPGRSRWPWRGSAWRTIWAAGR